MNRKRILKSPRFVPFGANLVKLETKSAIPGVNCEVCVVPVKYQAFTNWPQSTDDYLPGFNEVLLEKLKRFTST